MAVRIAINGFGRTGRALYRAVLERHLYVEVAAINDLGDPADLAYLLRHDSVHGPYREPVALEGDRLVTDHQRTLMLHEGDIAALPWKELGVEVVAECTGRATNRDFAAMHLEAGAERVVVSAPCRGADATFVIGVNEHAFDPTHDFVVSNASCTTNCFALLAKVLDDSFGIESGLMSTVHAYTGGQQLVDGLHKDRLRGRAAALNIVPTSTGAARATGLVLESLRGRVDGISLRVPVADGSLTDFVALVPTAVERDEVNAAFQSEAEGRLGHVLAYSDEPLVSTDVVGSTASCLFDASLTMVQDRLVKIFGWYDNETAYSNRLAELCALLGSRS